MPENTAGARRLSLAHALVFIAACDGDPKTIGEQDASTGEPDPMDASSGSASSGGPETDSSGVESEVTTSTGVGEENPETTEEVTTGSEGPESSTEADAGTGDGEVETSTSATEGGDTETNDDDSSEDSESETDTGAERCMEKGDPGECTEFELRFEYEARSNRCLPFQWGGCDGNVPFETLADCSSACGSVNILDQGTELEICDYSPLSKISARRMVLDPSGPFLELDASWGGGCGLLDYTRLCWDGEPVEPGDTIQLSLFLDDFLDACDAVEGDTFRFDLRSLDEHLPDGAVTLALGEHEVEYEPAR